MAPKKIIMLSVLVAAGIGGGLALKHYIDLHSRPKYTGEPQKTVEEVLRERANQASGHLMTPMGQAFVSKNWNAFKSQYQPETHYLELAEMIRAIYIQNGFSAYTAEDMDWVLRLTYDTLERIAPGNRTRAGLLVTQFYRLPLPQKNSSTLQQLEGWLNLNTKDAAFLRRLAISKLVLQDLHPPERAIQAFIAGFKNPPEGTTQAEWIRMTNDIRSVAVRERCTKELLKIYPQLQGNEQNQALLVLGQEPRVSPASIAKYSLDSLASEEQQVFEAGLRAISPLIAAKALNSQQKILVVKRLTTVPDKLKTPYVSAKIGDLMPKLTDSH